MGVPRPQLRPGPGQSPVSLGLGGAPRPEDSSAETQPSPSSCPSGLTHRSTCLLAAHLGPTGSICLSGPPAAAGSRSWEQSSELQVPRPALGRPLGQICTLGDPPPRGLPQGATPHLPVQWGPRPWEDSQLSASTPGHTSIFVAWPPPSGHASCGLPQPPPHILPSLRVTLTPSCPGQAGGPLGAGWEAFKAKRLHLLQKSLLPASWSRLLFKRPALQESRRWFLKTSRNTV